MPSLFGLYALPLLVGMSLFYLCTSMLFNRQLTHMHATRVPMLKRHQQPLHNATHHLPNLLLDFETAVHNLYSPSSHSPLVLLTRDEWPHRQEIEQLERRVMSTEKRSTCLVEVMRLHKAHQSLANSPRVLFLTARLLEQQLFTSGSGNKNNVIKLTKQCVKIYKRIFKASSATASRKSQRDSEEEEKEELFGVDKRLLFASGLRLMAHLRRLGGHALEVIRVAVGLLDDDLYSGDEDGKANAHQQIEENANTREKKEEEEEEKPAFTDNIVLTTELAVEYVGVERARLAREQLERVLFFSSYLTSSSAALSINEQDKKRKRRTSRRLAKYRALASCHLAVLLFSTKGGVSGNENENKLDNHTDEETGKEGRRERALQLFSQCFSYYTKSGLGFTESERVHDDEKEEEHGYDDNDDQVNVLLEAVFDDHRLYTLYGHLLHRRDGNTTRVST
jgi:hypothetical protein